MYKKDIKSKSKSKTQLLLGGNLIFLFTCLFLFFLSCIFLLLFSQNFTFATPPDPSNPAALSMTIPNSVISFHFTQSENSSAVFKKSSPTAIYIHTNNKTGFTAYVSSIDEDTNLNHSDSSVSQKITSISTPLLSSAFISQSWGYRIYQSSPANDFKPIPKASNPDIAFTYNGPFSDKFFIDFGIKPGPNLVPGIYSKQIIFTAVTNYVPKIATFLPGTEFNDVIKSLNPNHDTDNFKQATSAPANLSVAKIVSTTDSERPIYAWYDSSVKTIFWWSDADVSYANQDAKSMFSKINQDTSHVQLIDLSGINTSKTKNMSFMFFSGTKLYKKIKLDHIDTSNVEDMSYMFGTENVDNPIDIDSIDFSHFNTSRVKNMQGMFHESFLPSIEIRNFNTENVANMSFMFKKLNKITYLNLAGLKTRSVVTMDRMFYDSDKITHLDVSGWQNDSVTNMFAIFAKLSAMTNFIHTGFITKNVQNMEFMFSHCHSLVNLDLREFDTSNAVSMKFMFEEMTSINSMDLSSFNTSKVVDMSNMFLMWSASPPMTSLDLSSFNTSNVVYMGSMFQGHKNLTYLNISSFDTRKVQDMSNMFLSAMKNPGNGTLDISNFDTRSLTNAKGMFTGIGVRTIYTSSNFVVNRLTEAPQTMFEHAGNLVGGNGTSYIWPNYGSNFAHIDAPGNPGYFTGR